MADPRAYLRRQRALTRASLSDAAHDVRRTVGLDGPRRARLAPWIALGGVVSAGYAAGRRTGRRGQRERSGSRPGLVRRAARSAGNGIAFGARTLAMFF